MRLQEKSLSKLTLLDLLRRKRKNLSTHLKETGIVTYERLVRTCSSVGLVPPTEKQFMDAMGNPTTPKISSPTDGILVLEPPPINDIADSQVQQETDVESTSSEPSLEGIQDDTKTRNEQVKILKKKKKFIEPSSVD